MTEELLRQMHREIGTLTEKAHNTAQDVSEIKVKLEEVLKNHHDRLVTVETTDKYIKRAAAWVGTAIVGVVIWLFKAD
jgi:ElaB/YqjD/DUF883 family membrane-anchored ribosome-binding protein